MPPLIKALLGRVILEGKLPICCGRNSLHGREGTCRYVRERLIITTLISITFYVAVSMPMPLVLKPEAIPPTLCVCALYIPSMKLDASGVIAMVHPLSRTIAKSSKVIDVKLGLFESTIKAIKAQTCSVLWMSKRIYVLKYGTNQDVTRQ